jgi:hypothetical protein
MLEKNLQKFEKFGNFGVSDIGRRWRLWLRIDEQAAFFISLLACLVITIVNRAAIIEQLKQTQEMLAKLLALLEAGAADKCAAHLYQPCRAIARHVREAKQGQQRHRTRSHLKLSGRAESGIRR